MAVRRFSDGVFFLVLLSISILVYANSLRNSFHFDDQHYVVENPYIRALSNIPLFFTSPRYSSFDIGFTGHYRPLTVSTYALNFALGGLDPIGYHFGNLFLHVGSAWLIFLILSRLVPCEKKGEFSFAAGSAALLFTVHPFFSEGVNYITARSSVLCAFFYLLSFYAWIRFREDGKRSHYAMALAAFALGLLSKEVAITLPVTLWIYDLYGRRGRSVVPYMPFLLLASLPYLWVRNHYYGQMVPIHLDAAFWDNLRIQPYVMVQYLGLLFFPRQLTLDHNIPVVHFIWDPKVLIPGLCLLFIFTFAFILMRRGGEWRVVSFFIVWFFVALLPTALVPLNAILQENRGYLAGIGFVVVEGVLLAKIRRLGRLFPWIIVLGLIALYAAGTYHRNTVWKNDVSLWTDAVSKAPDSPRAHDNLGLALWNSGQRAEEAKREFMETIRLNPHYFYAYYNLGVVYQSQGQLDEAVSAYERSIQNNPSFFRAYYNLGLAYKGLGMTEAALKSYQKALAIDRRYPFLYNNIGVIYLEKKAYDEAVKSFIKAIQIDPTYAKAYYNLGNVHMALNQRPQAVEAYQGALRMAPGYPLALEALNRIRSTSRSHLPAEPNSNRQEEK